MPFDGLTPKSKLLQLRDLIANVPDEDYHQDFCSTCAMGHAYRAGLLSFDPEARNTVTGIIPSAAAELGVSYELRHHFFGFTANGGPANRTEFLARLDAYIASTVLA